MIVRPTVFLAMGTHGISVLDAFLKYLQDWNPRLLPFVRCCGICDERDSVTDSWAPTAEFDNGDLVFSSSQWIRRLNRTRVTDDIDSFVGDVGHQYDILFSQALPAAYPFRVQHPMPRLALVCDLHEPFVKDYCLPKDPDEGVPSVFSRLQDRFASVYATPGGHATSAGAFGVFFVDGPSPLPSLETLHTHLETGWKQRFYGFLVSRLSGVDRLPLWNAGAPWDSQYMAGLNELTQTMLSVFLFADGQLEERVFAPETQAPFHIFRSLAVSRFAVPSLNVKRLRTAEVAREQLLHLEQHGAVDSTLTDGGHATTLLSDQDSSNLDDPKLQRRIVDQMVGAYRPGSAPKETKGADESAPLANDGLLETLQDPEIANYLGQANEIDRWRHCMERLFKPDKANRWIKLDLDTKLQTRIQSQIREIDLMTATICAKQGLAKGAWFMETLLAEVTTSLGALQVSFPSELPDFKKEDEQLTQIQEDLRAYEISPGPNMIASLFYSVLVTLVLGLGASYFVWGVAGSFIYKIAHTCFTAAACLLLGWAAHWTQRREYRAAEGRRQNDLVCARTEAHGKLQNLVSDIMAKLSREYGKLFKQRAARSLRRLLTRQAERLSVYRDLLQGELNRADQLVQNNSVLSNLNAASWSRWSCTPADYALGILNVAPIMGQQPTSFAWPSVGNFYEDTSLASHLTQDIYVPASDSFDAIGADQFPALLIGNNATATDLPLFIDSRPFIPLNNQFAVDWPQHAGTIGFLPRQGGPVHYHVARITDLEELAI